MISFCQKAQWEEDIQNLLPGLSTAERTPSVAMQQRCCPFYSRQHKVNSSLYNRLLMYTLWAGLYVLYRFHFKLDCTPCKMPKLYLAGIESGLNCAKNTVLIQVQDNLVS